MKYFVNAEKGIVVAVMEDSLRELIALFEKQFPVNDIGQKQRTLNLMLRRLTGLTAYQRVKGDFKGFARCNLEAGDEFDIDFGTLLASNRAQRYFWTMAQNIIQDAYVDIYNYLPQIEKIAAPMSEKVTHLMLCEEELHYQTEQNKW